MYLRYHKVKFLVLYLSIFVMFVLPLTVQMLVRSYEVGLVSRATATPLVGGKLGSRFDLVLHALYFRGKLVDDLCFGELRALQDSGLAVAYPLLSKHTARGIPIVGTSLEYFLFRGLRAVDGGLPVRIGDCVLGSAAARDLGLRTGATLMSDPENVFDLSGSYPLNMRVTGILAATGTPDDHAIFADIKTTWVLMGLMHGHENVADVEEGRLLRRQDNEIVASAAVLPFQEVTDVNMSQYHFHGDPDRFPAGVAVVVPHDAKSSTILRGRYLNPGIGIQLLQPVEIVRETLDLVFRVKRFFDMQSVVVMLAMVLLLFLIVLLSLRLRRGEMHTMFKIGCARGTLFWLQTLELAIVIACSAASAVLVAWVLSRTGTDLLLKIVAD
jgi:putative ABC transport system permease protein